MYSYFFCFTLSLSLSLSEGVDDEEDLESGFADNLESMEQGTNMFAVDHEPYVRCIVALYRFNTMYLCMYVHFQVVFMLLLWLPIDTVCI